ncbi:UNVERIFIED_CONTAM: Nudix hydrolase 15, mitochondrial [Sesamum calycinum]|uniref:Nudix hydrolase 15, mitochondrial n=1 Tax=Sesamum calycinum TaxID=2727403 RepID=A0AAW2Q783_9LAMI
MDSCAAGPSRKLMALAQQLRLYKPPSPQSDDDEEEQRIEESAGKVVSQVGFAESATSVARQTPERFRPKRAAVLICLFEGDHGELRVILTKRSSKLSTHSGEVSLPGGKAEETDANDAETATREANEEIGLDPSLVNVVTSLEPFLSKHLLRVIPVIGILSNKKDFTPSPNAAEVEAIFDAPLEMFLKDENRRAEEREWMNDKYLIHFFDYEVNDKKYVIWGLTAGILIRAASVVYQTPPAFLEQNPKFKSLELWRKKPPCLNEEAIRRFGNAIGISFGRLVGADNLYCNKCRVYLYMYSKEFHVRSDSKILKPAARSFPLIGKALKESTSLRNSRIQDSAPELFPQGVVPSRAAVLICLFEGERGDLRVILTKRSSAMSSHSGEVALPGGKWEEGDKNDAETALREAKEEIGLDPSIVEVVTILEPFYTKRNITVFPVVGIIWNKNEFNAVPNASEVESVFDAPLEMFLKNENRREEKREWMGYSYLLHFFDYRVEGKSYVIWALTAAILIKAASVIYQQPPAFEEHRPKFWSRSRQ